MKLKMKLKLTIWYECLRCSHKNKTKTNKIKLLNGKFVVENEVMEKEIKNEIKVETRYCTKIK